MTIMLLYMTTYDLVFISCFFWRSTRGVYAAIQLLNGYK